MTNNRTNIEYYLGVNSETSKWNVRPLFQLHYGDMDFIDTSTDTATMGIRMSCDNCPVDLVETWYAEQNSQVTTGCFHDGKLHYVEAKDTILIFGELGQLHDIENTTFNAFQATFETLRDKGYQYLLRSWNLIPSINGYNKDGIENYQAFCKSRALAFIDAGLQERQMPAATGIGSHSRNICGYLLATKRSDYIHLENALQRPAYEYPRRYGPKSPSFARATLFDGVASSADTPTQFFLSGTASIRRSETMWQDDIVNQVQTMMENVSYLVGTENARISGHSALIELVDFEHFKVYYRRNEDYQIIKDILVDTWHISAEKLIFMNVDICRSDLLVEVEGCINRLRFAEKEMAAI